MFFGKYPFRRILPFFIFLRQKGVIKVSQKYNIEFNPIQCTSQVFKNLTPQDGFLYFVTDTKQMKLAKDGKFIDMCGGLNIVYGNKEIEYENSGQTPDPEVTFYIYELEKQEAPLVGDLILNIDGCFYKVVSVDEDIIETTRVTLQGSGTGTGGGGSGDITGGSYSINVPNSTNIFSSMTEKMEIEFIGYYNGIDDNFINYVSFSIGPVSETNRPFYEITNQQFAFNVSHKIDLINFIDNFGSEFKTVYINTEDKYGSQRSKKFTIQVVDLSLKAEKDIIFSSKEDYPTYSCLVSGAKSGIENKKIICSFFNEDNLNAVIYKQEIELDSNFTGSKQFNLNFIDLNHGVYVMTVQAEAKILGSATIIKSNLLTHRVVRFNENIGNALFAINIPEKTEQYTNIPLSYLLSTKEDNKNYTLSIGIDGKEETQLNITSNTLDSYTLYFETKGNYSLELYIVELGIKKNFMLTISGYTGNLPIINPNDTTLMLYLTPKGQSNNSVNRDTWIDQSNNKICIIVIVRDGQRMKTAYLIWL